MCFFSELFEAVQPEDEINIFVAGVKVFQGGRAAPCQNRHKASGGVHVQLYNAPAAEMYENAPPRGWLWSRAPLLKKVAPGAGRLTLASSRKLSGALLIGSACEIFCQILNI